MNSLFRTVIFCSVVLGPVIGLAACVAIQSAEPGTHGTVSSSGEQPVYQKMTWLPLTNDGIHDAGGPAISLLQNPAEALATLPTNKPRRAVGSYRTIGIEVNSDGNKVDWVQALKDNIISPRRARIIPESGIVREDIVMDMDIFLDLNGSMPVVRFPHLAHTMWLACANCHPNIFLPQAGSNPISMLEILNGRQCGICHRAVSFPPTDCARCHSLDRRSPEGIKVRADAREKERVKAAAKAAEKQHDKGAGGQP